MGVCPLGAQVERTEGSNETPDSSWKTMQAPRLLAFFYPGPGRLHPGGDRLVVSFGRLAGGALAAPAEGAQDLPDVSPVVADPGHGLDDASHPVEGPQVAGIALGAGTLPKCLLHGLELGG